MASPASWCPSNPTDSSVTSGSGGPGMVIPRAAAPPQPARRSPSMMWTRRWRRSVIPWTAPGSPPSPPNAVRRWLRSGFGSAAFPMSAPGSREDGSRAMTRGLGQAVSSGMRRWPPRCRIPPIRPRSAGSVSARKTRCATRRSTCRSMAGSHEHHPPGWPTAPEVGLPESLAATHDLIPVHPVTARHQLARALAEAGLTASAEPAARAVIAPGTSLRVRPTLSMRTVGVAGQPRSHIKLPLPTSTLVLLNRRFIKPGTLADGALVHSILTTAMRRDALLGGLMLADEGTYAHAGHPYLAYLLRRLPAGLEECRIVPVAALLAPSAGTAAGAGRPLVIEELADWATGGDLPRVLGAYLGSLFDLHVRLFVRYGIALEAHQQNTALVLRRPGEPTQERAPRLLLKDFDGALI